MVATVHPHLSSLPAVAMTLSSKGQLVIPKALRDRLGLKAGDVLSVEAQDDALVLRIVSGDRIDPDVAHKAVDALQTKLAPLLRRRHTVLDDVDSLIEKAVAESWTRSERHSRGPRSQKQPAQKRVKSKPSAAR
jgi:AbrB family looped-hinge helix DNA binding protein